MDKQPRHILLLSGGKDSTALAVHMQERHPEINLEYVFCDTHKELTETYEYLARVEAYLGKPVTRLSSGLGERGFDHWLKVYGDYLPSPNMRWCTRKLKIEPFEEYLGDDPAFLYIGIRADEHRDGYLSTKPNVTPVYPFKEDGVRKDEVFRLLERSGIGRPEYYEWRSRSGCYFCFFQRRAEWAGLLEHHPELYALAQGYEKEEQGYTWTLGESLTQLADPARLEEIRQNDRERKRLVQLRRKPRTLGESWGASLDDDPDDVQGCLICHL